MKTNQKIIERKKVMQRYHKIMEYPLTIAVASIGYGKSVSALEYLSSQKERTVIFSLDVDMWSAQQIWALFSKHIGKEYPVFGRKLHSIGFPYDFIQFERVAELFEEATAQAPLVVVIDDFHYCKSDDMISFLEKIVRRSIPGLHFLILSRINPTMHMQELIIKGLCNFIAPKEFYVEKDEVKEIFSLYSCILSEEEINRIYELCDGWISALYLILREYLESNCIIDLGSLELFIQNAVIHSLNQQTLNYLKKLSFMDSFTLEMARFVLKEENVDHILIQIIKSNSFIRYDLHDETYRIHKILKNHLIRLIRMENPPFEEDSIYRRAGVYCIQNQHLKEGLTYFLKAKAYDLIMNEFAKKEITYLYDSDQEFVLKLFEAIDKEKRMKNPIGYLSYLGFYVTNVNPVIGRELLKEASEYYKNKEDITEVLKARIAGEIELIRAYTYFNDLDKMYVILSKASQILKGESWIANERKVPTFFSPSCLYLYHRNKGKLSQTCEKIDATYPFYLNLSGGCGNGFEDQARAEYYLEKLELEKAEYYSKKAICKAEEKNQISIRICSYFTQIRANIYKGNLIEAKEMLTKLQTLIEQSDSVGMMSVYDVICAYVYTIIKDQSKFSEWITSKDVNESEILYQGRGFHFIVYGKYLLFRKEYVRLEVFCERMKKEFSIFNNQFGYLHAYILEAIAKFKLYGKGEAVNCFKEAIAIGKQDGIYLTFAEYGKEILPLFDINLGNEYQDNYFNTLLEAIIDYKGVVLENSQRYEAISHLTKREQEIFHLLVYGLTNQEIAKRLVVTEVTIRKAVTSIYRKLGVKNRANAIKIGLELK